MHYKDGAAARVYDVVKGKGYNLKNDDGSPREIVGVVVGLVPSSKTCNIQIATFLALEMPPQFMGVHGCIANAAGFAVGCGPNGNSQRQIGAKAIVEYGECESFEKIGEHPEGAKPQTYAEWKAAQVAEADATGSAA